jgi:hypothetical protein
MKKVILASVAVIATVAVNTAHATAAAASFCGGGTAGASAVTASSATDNFVRVPFSPKCSANTHVYGEDNNTYYRVGAASAKGKFPFYGSTVGGGVVASTTSCAATGCIGTDATGALTLGATG